LYMSYEAAQIRAPVAVESCDGPRNEIVRWEVNEPGNWLPRPSHEEFFPQ